MTAAPPRGPTESNGSSPSSGSTGPAPAPARLLWRTEGGRRWPTLVWRPTDAWRLISSGVDGGGLGERVWWLNTQVAREYHEADPPAHVRRIARDLGLEGHGVGMLTAAQVEHWTSAADAGVRALATVGLGLPVFAAASEQQIAAETAPVGPGTINLLVVVPVPVADAALVNLVLTVTEAKTQALTEAGVPGTGTSSDAVCVACPVPAPGEPVDQYGGPRSLWGARAARAVHAAIAAGTAGWYARQGSGPLP